MSATEFTRRFTRYRGEAIANKVIVITSHERVVGVSRLVEAQMPPTSLR